MKTLSLHLHANVSNGNLFLLYYQNLNVPSVTNCLKVENVLMRVENARDNFIEFVKNLRSLIMDSLCLKCQNGI